VEKLVKVIVVGAALSAGVLCLGCRRAKQPPIDCVSLVSALVSARSAEITTVRQVAAAGNACDYAEIAARAALDADLHGLVPKLLDAAPPNCKRGSILLGERAEGLARAAETDKAQAAAQDVLKADSTNPYAELALARVAYAQNMTTKCGELAAKARKDGRGVEAERWLGRSALGRSQYKEAEAHFQTLLQSNPNDAEAAFTAGVCNDKLGHYMQAREAFLQTLHIDPKHEMARVYLVMLTHNAGFNDEARHHLVKLGEIVPKDSPTYQQLAQLLDGNATADGGVADAGAPKPGTVQGKR
jgi:tetratricopeptide (TPR) repeat protein